MERADSEFVARMDVDDICEPNRLGRQLEFMLKNKDIVVLGAQAAVFRNADEEKESQESLSFVAHNIPTHPVLVSWEMMFRCALVHPTAMLRRSAVLQCGGYCNAVDDNSNMEILPKYIEDYYLWSRVLSRLIEIRNPLVCLYFFFLRENICCRYPCSIANLPDVLLRLRVHNQSKSKIEAIENKTSAKILQKEMFTRLLRISKQNIEWEEATLDSIQGSCLVTASTAVSSLLLLREIMSIFWGVYCKGSLREDANDDIQRMLLQLLNHSLERREREILKALASNIVNWEEEIRYQVSHSRHPNINCVLHAIEKFKNSQVSSFKDALIKRLL